MPTKDWIAMSDQPKCLDRLGALQEDRKRSILLQFIERYHAIYAFEVLDLPIAFLKAQDAPNSGTDPAPDRETAAAHIQEGKYEYSFSLNYLSDALERLLSDEVLQSQDTRNIVNWVLEAYACNEPQPQFLERELTHLSALATEQC